MKKIIIPIIILVIIMCSLIGYILLDDKKINAKIIEVYDELIVIEEISDNVSKNGSKIEFKLNNYDKSIIKPYNYVTITYSNITKKIKNIELLNKDENATIIVFLKNNITDIEIQETIKDIKSLDNVVSVIFESKDSIKEEMSYTSDILKEILNGMDKNPLLDTITVFVNSEYNKNVVAKTIEKLDNVEVVKY